MSSLLYVKIQVGTYFFFDQTQVDEIIALWSQLDSLITSEFPTTK